MQIWRLNTLPDLLTALGWLYNGLSAEGDGYAIHKGWLDVVRLTSLTADTPWPKRAWAQELLESDPATRSLATELTRCRNKAYRRLPFELRASLVREVHSRLRAVSFDTALPKEGGEPPRLLKASGADARHAERSPRHLSSAVRLRWDAPFQTLTFLHDSIDEQAFNGLLETEGVWGHHHVALPSQFLEPILYSGVAKNPFLALDKVASDFHGEWFVGEDVHWDLVTSQARQLTVSLGAYLRSGLERNPSLYLWRYLQKLERLSLYFRARLLVVPESASHALFAEEFPEDAALLHPIMADLQAGLPIARYLERLPQMLAVYEKLTQAAGVARPNSSGILKT